MGKPAETDRRHLKSLSHSFTLDFIITCSSHELLINEVRPLVEAFLRERGLELSADKTHVTRIQDGFDFLGQHLRKYGGKLLVTPSKKNTQVFLAKVRGVIETNK